MLKYDILFLHQKGEMRIARMSEDDFLRLVIPRMGILGDRALKICQVYGEDFRLDVGDVLLQAAKQEKTEAALTALEEFTFVGDESQNDETEKQKIILSIYGHILGFNLGV